MKILFGSEADKSDSRLLVAQDAGGGAVFGFEIDGERVALRLPPDQLAALGVALVAAADVHTLARAAESLPEAAAVEIAASFLAAPAAGVLLQRVAADSGAH